MGEGKFADEDYGGAESKFADEGKHADAAGESKFAETPRDKGPGEETAMVEASTVFGKDPIVGKLVEFWGETLSADINTFFADNCHVFDVDDNEHKLVYSKLHKKYEKILESHLQNFRTGEGITEDEMYARVRTSTDENELSQMIMELILCCADFECFVDIMKSKQRQAEMLGDEARVRELETKS